MLKVLDLFSGIGGFSLGLERTGGFETVAFCEIEDYPRKVLAKHWPDVPIHRDVRELDGNDYAGRTDLICGGYPCQPFSHAGKRKGEEDDRHLWPEVKRLVATIRPTWCLFENVAGHITMGLDEVLSDLESEGYTGWPVVIPACAVDAPHRRDRVWIVANAESVRPQRGGTSKNGIGSRGANGGADKSPGASVADRGEDVAHTNSLNRWPSQKPERSKDRGEPVGYGGSDVSHSNNSGCDEQRGAKPVQSEQLASERSSGWLPEPPVGRVAHGIPRRVDRLKGLGNAIVPQVVTMLGNAILEAEIGGS